MKFLYELGACTKDVDLGWYQLPAGSLGGCVLRYVGTVDDVKRVELRMDWQMTPHTDPHWDIQGCYITKIDGDPCIYSKHMILPKPGTVSPPRFALPVRILLHARSVREDRHDGDRHACAELHSRGG